MVIQELKYGSYISRSKKEEIIDYQYKCNTPKEHKESKKKRENIKMWKPRIEMGCPNRRAIFNTQSQTAT